MNPNLLRAVAALLGALAFVLNGHYDATAIGEVVLSVFAVVVLVQAQVKAHSEKPVDDTHPSPPAATQ